MTLARHHLSKPSGATTSVLCVHGFTQTAQSWHPFAAAMTGSCDVHAVDAPGHGLSLDGTRTLVETGNDIAAVAYDIADVAEDLAPVVLMGYSMGARMALHAALQHPSLWRGLILVSGTAGIDDEEERRTRRASDNALADHIEAVGVPAFVDEWLAQPMFATLNARAARRDERLTNTARGLADSLRHAGTGTQAPLWEALSGLTIPTLIVSGSLDTKFTALAQRMASHIASSRLEVISGAGHTVHLEAPEAFHETVRRFIAGLAQAPPHR